MSLNFAVSAQADSCGVAAYRPIIYYGFVPTLKCGFESGYAATVRLRGHGKVKAHGWRG